METRPVVIITGGGRGIGAATARLLGGAGYAVCVNYQRDREAAEAVVRDIEAAGGAAVAVKADVAEPGEVARLFDEAERALGPVTALVNNAGITGRIGLFQDAEAATLRRVLDVNVLGVMLCAQQAIRRWSDHATAGVMVNVSSIASTLGAPNEYVHYAAAKAAVEAFTVGLAKEVAPRGVRVNCVAPGTTYTDIHAAAGEPDRPARVAPRVPMGRIGKPGEIANAIAWLLSPQASYVTGAVLRVSGGL